MAASFASFPDVGGDIPYEPVEFLESPEEEHTSGPFPTLPEEGESSSLSHTEELPDGCPVDAEPQPSTHDAMMAAFPFPQIRPAQTACLAVAASSYDGNKRFSIFEVPTGGGKSPVSMALARFSSRLQCDHPGAHILTSQNNLLTQMMADFGPLGLVDLKGKANYTCAPHHTDCANGSSSNPENKLCADCPYKAAKDRFQASPIGVTNYTYYLTESRFVGRIEPKEYLICDEAHNLEDAVLSTVEVQLSRSRCEELDVFLPSFGDDQTKVRDWLSKSFLPKANTYCDRLRIGIGDEQKALAGDSNAQSKTLQVLQKKLASLMGITANIDAYLADDGSRWLAWSEKDGKVLTIRPLSAADYAQDYVLGRSPNVVLLSATLLDPGTFQRSLGIDSEQTNYYAAPSDFPRQNRRIVYWPTGSMSYRDIDATLPRIAARAEKLVEKYADSKGIIHTHSYRINQFLADYFAATRHRHRIITHTSETGDRERAIAAHYRSEDSTILLSPSMTEGLDLKDDLSRFQIITKVPYPFLDPYTRARMERDAKWYQLKTALTLVQATGRSVRSASDWAVTVILDSAFERFLVQNQHILPEWWKDAIEFKG